MYPIHLGYLNHYSFHVVFIERKTIQSKHIDIKCKTAVQNNITQFLILGRHRMQLHIQVCIKRGIIIKKNFLE